MTIPLLAKRMGTAVLGLGLVSVSQNPCTAQVVLPKAPVEIDVPAELHKRFNVPTGKLGSRPGRDKSTGRGFHAIVPVMDVYRKFINIKLEKIASVRYLPPDPNSLPAIREETRRSIANCFDVPYQFDQDLVYKTKQVVQTELQNRMQSIKEFKASTSFNISYLNKIGIESKDESATKQTFDVENGSSSQYEQEELLTKREKFSIPSMTEAIIYYSDMKRRAEIPVEIVALIDAQLVEQEIFQRDGRVWDEVPISTLVTMAKSPEDRTFTVRATIYLQGTNGSLSSRYLSRPLTKADPACADTPLPPGG